MTLKTMAEVRAYAMGQAANDHHPGLDGAQLRSVARAHYDTAQARRAFISGYHAASKLTGRAA